MEMFYMTDETVKRFCRHGLTMLVFLWVVIHAAAVLSAGLGGSPPWSFQSAVPFLWFDVRLCQQTGAC